MHSFSESKTSFVKPSKPVLLVHLIAMDKIMITSK